MRTNRVLWIAQSLLFLLFAFAGGVKLVLPPEAMQGPVHLPILFVRFIGVAEVLGALGLVLPGLFRLRRDLTPLAAGGLVIIMAGATVITAIGGALGPALFPAAVGMLAAWVAYSRRPWLNGIARPAALAARANAAEA
jgi:hypothetical protein